MVVNTSAILFRRRLLEQSIAEGRHYSILNDADGRDDEFACIRRQLGFAAGLSHANCHAEEQDSLFQFANTGRGTFRLFSYHYEELKAAFPWTTSNGHGRVEFSLESRFLTEW